MCTFSGSKDNSDLHIERITKDHDFWSDLVFKAERFFRVCILPELLGKWYTKPRVDSEVTTSKISDAGECSTNTSTVANSECFCSCQGPEEGDMIACDNSKCKIEWFHLKCLKMSKAPKGKAKWYCPDCRKLEQFKRSKKSKPISK